jgi:hypothetical protein
MMRGVSLHVGINEVDVAAFEDRRLVGCENDAIAMSDIARSSGFQDVTVLRGPEATFERVKRAIEAVAEGPNRLVAGDIFLFTFAGHGSRISNPELEETLSDEQDAQDESLVLFDRHLLDDYLQRVLWPKFAKGVRIVGVADSCHSATVFHKITINTMAVITEHLAPLVSDVSGTNASVSSVPAIERVSRTATPIMAPGEDRVVSIDLPDRAITDAARIRHRENFKPFYDELKIPQFLAAPAISADLLFLAACEDGKTTKDGLLHTDGLLHGAFTRALLEVWENGAFAGSYITFIEAIRAHIAAEFPGQRANLTPEVPPAFSVQKPFSI